MKVFWWQAGLHIEPENDADMAALTTLCSILKLSSLATPPLAGTDVRDSGIASPAASSAQK